VSGRNAAHEACSPWPRCRRAATQLSSILCRAEAWGAPAIPGRAPSPYSHGAGGVNRSAWTVAQAAGRPAHRAATHLQHVGDGRWARVAARLVVVEDQQPGQGGAHTSLAAPLRRWALGRGVACPCCPLSPCQAVGGDTGGELSRCPQLSAAQHTRLRQAVGSVSVPDPCMRTAGPIGACSICARRASAPPRPGLLPRRARGVHPARPAAARRAGRRAPAARPSRGAARPCMQPYTLPYPIHPISGVAAGARQ